MNTSLYFVLSIRNSTLFETNRLLYYVLCIATYLPHGRLQSGVFDFLSGPVSTGPDFLGLREEERLAGLFNDVFGECLIFFPGL